jgi:hypothetical protein
LERKKAPLDCARGRQRDIRHRVLRLGVVELGQEVKRQKNKKSAISAVRMNVKIQMSNK